MSKSIVSCEISLYLETRKGAWEAHTHWPLPETHGELIAMLSLTLSAVAENHPSALRMENVEYFGLTASLREWVGESAKEARDKATEDSILPKLAVDWTTFQALAPLETEGNHATG